MKELQETSGMILAEFNNPAELLAAAEKMRDAGYKKFDCHSPFPIHGMDEAMGLKRSPLGWMVGTVAFLALAAGFTLEWWTSTVDYPIVISGKPFFSYQAYGPVAFAIMVLSSAFVALFGMMGLNKLPMLYHKLFDSEKVAKITNDGFIVSVLSNDPLYDETKTQSFLKEIGGQNLEVI
ncbi:MAG: DUF3341 domain-containing protein [Calditrichales bacterium]|nr:MAG: DUF3341 domain-containing protein [Calditrichales bacterium]